MMEEKSAAKCTKRFLREGGKEEKRDRETERGGVENAVAAADGGDGGDGDETGGKCNSAST